jgi:hypothetical protein
MLVGAVAAGLDPDYEPLNRVLSHLAQRLDMTMSHFSDYLYENYDVEGGLVGNRDSNAYTRWLYYTVGHTDMGSKGGGRTTKVWGH